MLLGDISAIRLASVIRGILLDRNRRFAIMRYLILVVRLLVEHFHIIVLDHVLGRDTLVPRHAFVVQVIVLMHKPLPTRLMRLIVRLRCVLPVDELLLWFTKLLDNVATAIDAQERSRTLLLPLVAAPVWGERVRVVLFHLPFAGVDDEHFAGPGRL